MLDLWINYAIALASLFFALMSWFRVRPRDIARATGGILRGAQRTVNFFVAEKLGYGVFFTVIVFAGLVYQVITLSLAGSLSGWNLVAVIITLFSFILIVGRMNIAASRARKRIEADRRGKKR